MWVLYLHYCKVWTHPNNTVFLNHKFKYVCAAVSGLFFHYAHESKEKVFFRKSQYRLLAKYLQHSVRDSLYHWNKYQRVLIIIFATQSSDVLNTILSNKLEHHFSNIERTQTCSSIGDRTRTPYSWLWTIAHRTFNIVWPITNTEWWV